MSNIRHLRITVSRYRLVVPHEELGVFLENLLRNLAGHGDDCGVVALLPGAITLAIRAMMDLYTLQ